jgi:hypothetical protein
MIFVFCFEQVFQRHAFYIETIFRHRCLHFNIEAHEISVPEVFFTYQNLTYYAVSLIHCPGLLRPVVMRKQHQLTFLSGFRLQKYPPNQS